MKFTDLLVFTSILVASAAVLFVTLCSGHYEWNTFKYTPTQGDTFVHTEVFTRTSLDVPIEGSKDEVTLHGWLYKPNEVPEKPLPIVLIAHGLGAQKDMGLENYASHFVSQGYAALVIDYRYFGGSSQHGNMYLRNYINPWNHVADIKAAVRFIRNNGLEDDTIDRTAIALWGTSFAGGHMLRVAAELGPSMVKCVISQVPHLDGRGASKRGIAQRGVIGTLRVVLIALADYLTSELLGLAPMYVKIVGTSRDVSYMILDSPEEMQTYYAKHPMYYLGGWRNLAPARTLAVLSLYNPIESVRAIQVPVLFVAALDDALCPIEYVRAAASATKNARLLELSTNHFGVYMGEPLREALQQMSDFLAVHLK